MLFGLGAVQIDVYPVSIKTTEYMFGSDYAEKPIVGAMQPLEWMGPKNGTVTLSCALFPQKFGGLSSLMILQGLAIAGIPQMLIRGDGMVLGFWVIDQVSDSHTYIDRAGVGRMVEVEINLIQSPMGPSIGGMIETLLQLEN